MTFRNDTITINTKMIKQNFFNCKISNHYTKINYTTLLIVTFRNVIYLTYAINDLENIGIIVITTYIRKILLYHISFKYS